MLLRFVSFFRNYPVNHDQNSKYCTRRLYGRHNSKNKIQAAGTISYVVTICEQRISVAENIHTDRMNSQESSAYRHQYFIEALRSLREKYSKVDIEKFI